jgi:hypothetical protein
MKLSDFILLSEEQKKGTLLHQGVLIGKRTYFDCLVFLFQLNNYYVESYCNRRNKAVVEFRVFTDTKHLQPYLEAIQISDLLN